MSIRRQLDSDQITERYLLIFDMAFLKILCDFTPPTWPWPDTGRFGSFGDRNRWIWNSSWYLAFLDCCQPLARSNLFRSLESTWTGAWKLHSVSVRNFVGMISNTVGNIRSPAFGRFCARLFLKQNSHQVVETFFDGGKWLPLAKSFKPCLMPFIPAAAKTKRIVAK